jgi:HEAT repeat protein
MSALTRDLQHRDWQKRRAAAEQLGRLGAAADEAVPALIEALADAHEAVRQAAADALGRIEPDWATGDRARAAVPALVKALGGRSGDAAQHASAVLARIGAATVPALTEALADEEKDGRQALAARTLGRIGGAGAAAAPALAGTLRSAHTHVRQAAAEALGRVGPAAESAVPALAGALTDWSPAVR